MPLLFSLITKEEKHKTKGNQGLLEANRYQNRFSSSLFLFSFSTCGDEKITTKKKEKSKRGREASSRETHWRHTGFGKLSLINLESYFVRLAPQLECRLNTIRFWFQHFHPKEAPRDRGWNSTDWLFMYQNLIQRPQPTDKPRNKPVYNHS